MGKMTLVEHLKACAEAARNFTNSLVGNLATTVTETFEEMDAVKADKPSAVSTSITVAGWVSDSSVSGYSYRYDIAAESVTAKDIATVSIDPSSMAVANACGMCPANETLAGKIRLRATTLPTAAIKAEYWIEHGKE